MRAPHRSTRATGKEPTHAEQQREDAGLVGRDAVRGSSRAAAAMAGCSRGIVKAASRAGARRGARAHRREPRGRGVARQGVAGGGGDDAHPRAVSIARASARADWPPRIGETPAPGRRSAGPIRCDTRANAIAGATAMPDERGCCPGSTLWSKPHRPPRRLPHRPPHAEDRRATGPAQVAIISDRAPSPVTRSGDHADVLGLVTLLARTHVELDRLADLEAAVAGAVDTACSERRRRRLRPVR